jgi:hypothetical protein
MFTPHTLVAPGSLERAAQLKVKTVPIGQKPMRFMADDDQLEKSVMRPKDRTHSGSGDGSGGGGDGVADGEGTATVTPTGNTVATPAAADTLRPAERKVLAKVPPVTTPVTGATLAGRTESTKRKSRARNPAARRARSPETKTSPPVATSKTPAMTTSFSLITPGDPSALKEATTDALRIEKAVEFVMSAGAPAG